MANHTVFGGVISFLDRLGVYDIILPFLLIFTIVFAILDRTRVLGEDEIQGVKYPKKSLNAIVAFVLGFLVVASSQLVSVINQTVAQVSLLLVLVVMFMMLVGVFYGEEDLKLEGNWRQAFMWILFIALVAIILNASGWLGFVWDFLIDNYRTDWVASLILIGFIISFMVWIARDSGSTHKEAKHE